MSENQMQHYGRYIKTKVHSFFFPLLSRFSCQQHPPLTTRTSILIPCLRASSAIVQSIRLPQGTKKKENLHWRLQLLLLRLWKHKRTKTTVDSPKRREDETPRIDDDDDDDEERKATFGQRRRQDTTAEYEKRSAAKKKLHNSRMPQIQLW
jgi:hypothetical protein